MLAYLTHICPLIKKPNDVSLMLLLNTQTTNSESSDGALTAH